MKALPAYIRHSLLVLFVLALFAALPAKAQQSTNHALHAVPPPGKVVIDGKLDDWNMAGQIESFANYRMKNTYSVKSAAMYDQDNLYLALIWRDPTPMFNMVDANFDIGSGWKSDCVQLRVLTDMPIHLDCWYSTAAKRPVINIQYGSFNPGNLNISNFAGVADALKVGAQEAFTRDEDGKSYIQEIALPWKLITAQNAINNKTGKPQAEPKSYKVGQSFSMGMEFLWGGVDGRTYPIHRYADLVSGSTREFFWSSEGAWGRVQLEPQGNVRFPQPDYSAQLGTYLQTTAGAIPLEYTMPFDGFATIVIEDETGHRVKNLIGMAPRSKGKCTDYWDGTDENGRKVKPGNYSWRGLVHQGIDPVYEATYGSPGVPPWDTGDGAGAWVSDHKPTTTIATGADMIVLGAEDSESGYGLVGVDLNGRKKWGERKFHGLNALAADDKYVYAVTTPWADPPPPPSVSRVELRTGKYAPFETTPTPQLTIPLAKTEDKAWVSGIAVTTDRLAIAISTFSVVRFLDKKTAAVLGEMSVPKVGCLAYDAAGTLFLTSDKSVMKVVNGKLVPVIKALPNWAQDMAIDAKGRIFICDPTAQQVRVFDKTGKPLSTIGAKGGRPPYGKWIANAMRKPAGIDIDAQGRLWVAENDASPKRISVWNVNGKLIKDYIGPTGYGGMGASADPDDKTRVYGSGAEFKMDYAKNKATVVAANGLGAGEWLTINKRKYFMDKYGNIFLRDGINVRRVGACGNVGVKDMAGVQETYHLPAAPKGTDSYTSISYVWMDKNDDGKVQDEEVATGSPWTGWKVFKYPIGVAGYFGSLCMDEQGNIYGVARETYGNWGGGRGPYVTKIPIKGWTPGGAPIWDLANQQLIQERGWGTMYLPSNGNLILGAPITGLKDNGDIMWTYNDYWSGVHASHNAPIPDRDDVLVGTLGCIGRATLSDNLGTVFAMHSNMGRLYLMTTDGLFIASVFQDSRIGTDPWPNEAKPGTPLNGVTMGSEWFGGHFFKSNSTNEYYVIAGFTAYNLIKLNGMESLKPLPTQTLKVTQAQLDAPTPPIPYPTSATTSSIVITQMAAAPKIDGNLDEYPQDRFVSWSSGPYSVRAAMATDDKYLYLAYDVAGDKNPMVNGGQDITQLFVTGDSVDLQYNTGADFTPAGHRRLLISVLNGKPVAMMYRWNIPGATDSVKFVCPWRSHTVDSVRQVPDANINITRAEQGYTVEAAIPLSALEITPKPGKSYVLDLGVVYSDPNGANRAARVYWRARDTGLTSDIPGEIMPLGLGGSASVKP